MDPKELQTHVKEDHLEFVWQETKQNLFSVAEQVAQKRPKLRDMIFKELEAFNSKRPKTDHEFFRRESEATHLEERWVAKARE